MTQIYYDDIFSQSHDADDDLTRMENNFAVLKSGFSGDVFVDESSNNYDVEPFMRWSDTSNKVPRFVHPDYGQDSFFESGVEEEFLGLMFGDEKHEIWVYRNDAMDGWEINDSVEDVICSISGDESDIYNTVGITQGSWSIGYVEHTHCWFISSTDIVEEKMYNINGEEVPVPTIDVTGSSLVGISTTKAGHIPMCNRTFSKNFYTDMSDSNQTSDWRPAAAVGTLQHINV